MSAVLRLCLVALVLAASAPALAHDPSAWGGTFRSRDGGDTWMPIDAGLFVGGAITIAVDPLEPNHLLYATDTRLLASRNGGRDWVQDQSPSFIGPTLGVAFSRDGKALIAATAAGIFKQDAKGQWQSVNIPSSASPALTLVTGAQPQQFYALGPGAAFRSDDHGETWKRISETLPAAPTALTIPSGIEHAVVCIVQGALYVSSDDGATWQPRTTGLPADGLEMLASDRVARRVWTAAAARLYRSDDVGMSWTASAGALPDADTQIRGVIANTEATNIAVSTHRGLFRSTDGGRTWQQVQGNLPVHLEAGPLVRDPHEANTLYLPFSLTPYHEIRRRAVEGSNLLARIDPMNLAGAGAFFILFVIGAGYAIRKLMQLSARRTTSGTH
jgi:photosystem II stability/assembly factor-like uncharacterized protein